MEIQYLTNKEINKAKWDDCIANSNSNLVYGYSWYLDGLTKWDALIVGEYEAVLPLPFKEKWGISYLYQPFFTQQLGLFSCLDDKSISLDTVLNKVPSKFKFWDIQLNGDYKSDQFPLKPKITMHINLNKDYDSIRSQYSKDAIKNIRKSGALNWRIKNSANIVRVIEDYKIAYGGLNPEITTEHYSNLKKVIEIATEKNAAYVYELHDENEERMASAVFLRSNKFIHYILGAPTPLGREKNATHILIDQLLKEFSNQDLTFDFEGSEIPSVANFYKKFGVIEHTFYKLKVNKLPFPLNLFKK